MDFDLFGKDCPSPIKRSLALREDQGKTGRFQARCGGKIKCRAVRACGWGVRSTNAAGCGTAIFVVTACRSRLVGAAWDFVLVVSGA
jgi:hypothetical protein